MLVRQQVMTSTLDTNRIAHAGPGLQSELFRLWGYESFQGKQEEVMSQVMAGVDTLAIMPTGAGKSLCYQLPAMLLPGTTLVISPLIALMKDQYDSLPGEVYERTTFINSTLEMDELSQRMNEIIEGKYKLVYCAPERLRHEPFVDALRRAKISLLVVDEAHCVSMWGHDFRPDYLFIGKCLHQLSVVSGQWSEENGSPQSAIRNPQSAMGGPTLLALTATATPEMRAEIASQLGRELKPVVASMFRPNLYYQVEEMSDKEQKFRRLVEICQSNKGTGVVYARSRETCEQLAAMLRRSGIQAGHYHAGMDAEERTRAQEAFMLDRVRVIVATIAFGMGIDKGNVRFIVHFSPPDSLEGYVQESGRAGRDARPAKCVLFVTPGDKSNLTRWKRQEQLKLDELRAIYRELAHQVQAGETRFVNFDELEQQASASLGKSFDGTQARVGVSLLERVGLIVRHADAPRMALITLTPKGERAADPEFMRFRSETSLEVGQATRRDTGVLSASMNTTPPALERTLLGWAERGWVVFRGERRYPIIERLQPPRDVADVINRMLDQRDQAQEHRIAQVLDYAASERCRHQALAAHLGEQIEECETGCDNCAPPADRPAASSTPEPELPPNPGQVIVECLASFPFGVGKPSLANALAGSAASNVKADRVRHFGSLAAASASAIQKAIEELIEQGYLVAYESDGYRLLRVTEEGFEGVPRDAVTMKQKKPPKAKTERSRTERKEPVQTTNAVRASYKLGMKAADEVREPTPEEVDLFERLKAWRRVVANRLNLPPYVIFHDKTLWAIARARPGTNEELLLVKGVGQSHIDRYGPDLLQLIDGEQG